MKFFILFTLIASCKSFPAPENPRKTRSNPLGNFKNWNPAETVAYLQRFGYVSKSSMPKVGSLIDINSFSKSIREFQRMAGIEATGKMDQKTMEMMSLPRCGVEDTVGAFMMGSDGNIVDSKFRNKNQRRKTNRMKKRRKGKRRKRKNRQKRYNLEGGRWSKSTLKYHISNFTPDLTESEVRKAIKKALNLWAKHSTLKFKSTKNPKEADLKISFGAKDHGDYYPFDGPGGTLAHAFFPSDGRAHFDDDEKFTVGSPRGINLFIVAAHEFGHSLGLAHSSVQDSLMAPFYQGYVPNYKLHSDDIAAIQQLYGEKERPNPDGRKQPPTPSTSTTVTPPMPRKKPKGNPMLICGDNITFDSMHYNYREKALYALKERFYWVITKDGAVPGYPKRIHDYWRGLPANINATVYSRVTGYTYFFKGKNVWKYSKSRKLAPGFPKKSSALGLPSNPQAAMEWGRDGLIYVFKNNRFYRFSELQKYNGKNPYKPKKTSKYWEGIPNRLDGAVQWENGETYFFKGDNFWRFSGMEKELDDHYPRSFKRYWVGCKDKNNPYAVEAKQAKKAEMRARRKKNKRRKNKKRNN